MNWSSKATIGLLDTPGIGGEVPATVGAVRVGVVVPMVAIRPVREERGEIRRNPYHGRDAGANRWPDRCRPLA